MLLPRRKINNHSLMLLLFVCLALSTMKSACVAENACYVCGIESTVPLIELNQTYASAEEKSCEEFDKLLPHEREAYEIACPPGMRGCITKIQSNNVMRTCSEIAIDDCKRVNGDLVCICNKKLCNGETSDNIRKTFDAEHSEEEDDNEEGDVDTEEDESVAESGDDALRFAEPDTTTDSSATNAADEVLMSTMRPSTSTTTTNRAVSFHFKNQLKIFYVLIFLQSSFVINNNF